ncbi:MAG TPA: helix-turn-helix domain-containing protein [Baekduia sp.]|nr:helix-turn-helix domain-containing protein [Baekduia sp.]
MAIPALGAVPDRSPACEALVRRTAERIEPGVGQIAEQLIARVLEEINVLDPGDEDLVEALHAASRGSVALLTAMTRTWTDPHVVPPPHEAVVLARGLVARGISIEVLIRTYRIGQAGYHDVWHRELGASGEDPALVLEALHACSAFFFTWVDAVLAPLIDAYEAERTRRLLGAQAVRADTVRAILAGEALDPAVAGARLGYTLQRPHVAVVAWASGARGEPRQDALADAVAAADRALGGDGRPLVLQLPGGVAHGWVGRPGPAAAALGALRDALRGQGCHVALGDAAEGVDGFRRSHEQAVRARRVARLLRPAALVTPYVEVIVADLLTRDVEAAREVARATLGPLARDDDSARRLLATLRTYLEEGQSFARTARRLGLHENTVAYRVRRAIELTGQDDAPGGLLQAAVTLAPLLDIQPAAS